VIDATYCSCQPPNPITHTYIHKQTHICGGDHRIPLRYKSPGRTCFLLEHPSCFPPLYLLHLFPFSSSLLRSLFHLPFHIHSASLLTLSLSRSRSPSSAFPTPSGYLFHSCRYIPSLTGSEKPMEIDVCSVPLWAVTWHDGEFNLSFVQQQLFCRVSEVLQALGIQPIFHRWAACCKTLTHSLSPYDLAADGASIHSFAQMWKRWGKYALSHIQWLLQCLWPFWFADNNEHENSFN